ncbi:MAG: carboxypeptidase regulatory-like domain-containing protein [Bacteroidetes bacterium]|nr:carboxypeptidase regulatory-like domain-containing protein [Bacteroidota bacterium]
MVLLSLTFTSGKIATGAYILTLGSAASVSGAGTGSYVFGTLRRNIPATTDLSAPFDVGDASAYTPVTLLFTGTPGGTGSIDVSTSVSQPPVASGISQSKYINRKWTVVNNGVSGFTSYSPTFTFVTGDKTGTPDPAKFVVRKYDDPNWTATTTGTKTSTTIQATGLTSFSEFAIGEQALDHFTLTLASPQYNGGAFTGTNTLTALDILGSICVGFDASSDNVTISANSPLIGSVSGLSGVNKLSGAGDFVSGVADLTSLGMKYSGNIGTGTFTATSGTGKTGGSGSVTINAGPAVKFIITGTGTQTAGNTQDIMITAKDVGDYLAVIYTGDKSITFSGASSSSSPVTAPTMKDKTGTATAFGTATTITFTNGVASVSGGNNGVMTLYKAEVATIVATDGLISTSGDDRLSVTVSSSSMSKFSFSLDYLQNSGEAFTGANTITAQDAYGNTVTGYDASTNNVTIIANSPFTGSVTGLSGTNKLNSAGDFVSGIAALTGYLTYSGLGGEGTFTATSASNGYTGTSGSVLIEGGTPTQIRIETAVDGSGTVVAAQDLAAGNFITVYAIERDAFGNFVTSPTSVSWSLVDITGGVTGDDLQPGGDGNSATFFANKVGTAIIQGTKDELTSTPSGTITVITGTLDNFLVEADGGGEIPSQALRTPFGIKITAYDSQNNTVTSFTGTVDIASTGTLSSGSGTTASFIAGVLASHNVEFSNTGNFTITATKTSGVETGSSNSFDVTAMTTVYVTSTGNDDTGDGSVENPFLTVQHGIDMVADDGTVDVASGVTAENINIGRNVTITGDGAPALLNISLSSGSTLSLGTAIQVSGTLTVNGFINLAGNIISGTGAFTLSSGATLKTAHADGITSSGATGSVQVAGTRTYSTEANYEYNGTSAQVTGNGLPSTVNSLIVSETSDLTLSNTSLTVSSGGLIIGSAAKFTIPVGDQLTVTGITTLDGNNCLVLKSDVSGQATFIDNGTFSGSGSASVEQYLTGSNASGNPNGRYYYVGSPVNNAYSDIYDAAGSNKLWSWSENSQTYTEITDNATSLFPQVGYVARLASTVTCIYYGTPNTGLETITGLSRTGFIDATRGFHLVSNCYPSGLYWNSVHRTNILPTLWYRTVNGSNTMVYDTYNAEGGIGTNNNGGGDVTGFIRPMQSFWVRVDADTHIGSLEFTNAMRSHSMSGAQKSEEDDRNILKLYASLDNNRDETVLLFNSGASDGYESWDSEKMYSNVNGLPEIYSIIPGSGAMVINCQSELDGPRDILLGFKTTQAGTFSIHADLNHFSPGYSAILEDTETGTFTDLGQGTYSFSSTVINTTTRFILHLGTIGISGKVTYDNTAKTPLTNATVELRDGNDQTLYTQQTDLTGIYRFTGIPAGTYKLHVSTNAPAGGWNAIDALAVMRHFTLITPLTGMKLLAGDADGTGYLNAIDALLIQKRFVGLITTFTPGDWIFEEKTITVSSGATLTENVKGICTGDTNGSYLPSP